MLQLKKEKTNRLLWDQPKNARPILEKTESDIILIIVDAMMF
jgi:hypothetical protein